MGNYVLHIAAGSAALLSGYIALYSTKGAPLHRRAGLVFVYTMIVMALAGAILAATRNAAPKLNIPVALLTVYLVTTSFTTVRPALAGKRWLLGACATLAFGVAVADLWFGIGLLGSSRASARAGAVMFFVFGAIALLGFAGDIRILRRGMPRGAPRIARHLWRMTFALLVASLSFFIGQAKVIPEPIRIMPLLALPVLLVLGTLLYWLWRVNVLRSLRGMSGVPATS
jgi:uncharacterized membrane protein